MPTIRMKRVLVTGATGFIGRHVLSPLLEREFDVHAVAHARPADEASVGIAWHRADLLDPAEIVALTGEVGATHLLHLAWCTEHQKYWEAGENLDWVAASLRLLRSFRANGGQRAVIAGTCAEYDWTRDCCDEGTPVRPASLYGVGKNALRQLLDAYSRSSGLSAAWGRVFFPYGPGEGSARVIPVVARSLVAGERVACSTGEQIRDFLYVADVANAFAALTNASAIGAVDIGSGEGVALREVLLRLERLAGRSGLVRLGAAPQRDEPARIVANSRRLRDELGWLPVHRLDNGLERTLSWWREGVANEHSSTADSAH